MTKASSEPHVGLVVEGRGDAVAVPHLLRKWRVKNGHYMDVLGKVVPCKGREDATKPNGIEGYVLAAAARPGCVGVLVTLDGEGDPVCKMGPQLSARATHFTRKPVVVSLADTKFESWLVASAETMGLTSLRFNPLADPVALIRAAMPSKYAKPIWQPRLADRIDFDLAISRNESLKRTLEKLDGLARLVEASN